MIGASMRRIQELVLGLNKIGISISSSNIGLLGVCYKISQEYSYADPAHSNGFAAFVEDFESRILMTYRKGFTAIGDSKYTSDVNWDCMLQSSQMLVVQALVFHRLGIYWRKPLYKPLNQEYVEILHYFGDSESSAFSIHNLLQAGNAVLSPVSGLWVSFFYYFTIPVSYGKFPLIRLSHPWQLDFTAETKASELADQLFTVTQTRNLLKVAAHHETSCDSSGAHKGDSFDLVPAGDAENNTEEDDWQIL